MNSHPPSPLESSQSYRSRISSRRKVPQDRGKPDCGLSYSSKALTTDSDTTNRLFIQLPVDVSDDPELSKLEEKGTRGHYTSVESFKELEDGRVEWRMATSSTPGGHIPNFIVESTMAGQIAAVSLIFCLMSPV